MATCSAPAPFRTGIPSDGTPSARDLFAGAVADEARGDDAAAESGYRAVVDRSPRFVDAYLNLGALLHDAGRPHDAIALYDAALRLLPDEPLLHFNRALALEDLDLADQSLAAYERCFALAPDMADAHWNAARLYEEVGRPQQALQHFSAYRRLSR